MRKIEQIFEITGKGVEPLGMPIGTKYMFFEPDIDFKEGNKVYASLFAGKRIGRISEITEAYNDEREYCLVDGLLTFISDIQYLIL